MSEDKNQNNPFAENEEIKEEIKEEPKEDIKEENIESKEEEFKKELDDINNKYLRLAADFDNYRKRQAQERESLLKYGAEDTLKKIIPVLDTLERAKNSIEKTEDIKTIKESYEICTKQFLEILGKIGLKKIEAKDKPFDPNLMEAVMQTKTNDVEPHTVIAELQAGYQLFDRVLRPTMVNVAVEDDEENKE